MTDFIITFRETLEASLVVGIILSYLSQLGNRSWYRMVFVAVICAIVLSIVAGYLFEVYLGGFSGVLEEVYEGIIMLTAAALISWMILWMLHQKSRISEHLRSQVDRHLASGSKIGIFMLVLISVLREGIETVLFLKASSLQAGGNNLSFALAGILVAIVLGYFLFTGLRQIPLRRFFSVTSLLLIFFAAGLVAHGVHELQEAGWIPLLVEHVWDVNPEVTVEGQYPLLHEEGAIGGVLKGVFGWNGNPNLLEVISYFAYLLVMLFIYRRMERKSAAVT